MTVNAPNKAVVVKIDEVSMGRTDVPHHPSKIEMLRVAEHIGVPHIVPKPDGTSTILVLGAFPNTNVTVTYYTEQD